MSTNFPTSADDGASLPNPGPGSNTDAPSHADQHSNANDAIKAIQAKVGIGASTPVANRVFRGTSTGVSAWAQLDLTTDVTGVLPAANGGTGLSALASGIATFLGTPTSANLLAAMTIKTGTGSLVFGTSPTIATPTITVPVIADFTSATHNHENTAGGGVLGPVATPDVAKSVNRQDNTTNSVVTNQLIQYGWGFVDGDSASRILSETVTFPVSYDSPPVVIVSSAGAITGTGVNINDFTTASSIYGRAHSITSTTFVASVSRVSNDGADPGVLANTADYSYVWIAIGTKAR